MAEIQISWTGETITIIAILLSVLILAAGAVLKAANVVNVVSPALQILFVLFGFTTIIYGLQRTTTLAREIYMGQLIAVVITAGAAVIFAYYGVPYFAKNFAAQTMSVFIP